MGIFQVILKAVADIKNHEKKMNEYKNMSVAELKELPDDALYDLLCETLYYDADSDEIDKYNPVQLTILTVMNFDAEIQNGGLCQFFVNSSRNYAPYVVESLKKIGADDIAKLFADFVRDNNIDVMDLSSFDVYDEEEFEEQEDRYPFDDFDDAYDENYEIEKLLLAYARNNLNDVL